ncbi:hypothetical protein ABID25_004878 [Mesorhizobium abyssinicae]
MRKRRSDLLLARRIIDLALQHAGQRLDVAMDPIEQQVDTQCRRLGIGANVFLVCGRQALADFRCGITRQLLNVPKRQTAAQQEVEQHRAANDQHEFRSKGAQAETRCRFVVGFHCGRRPDATQIGQPA